MNTIETKYFVKSTLIIFNCKFSISKVIESLIGTEKRKCYRQNWGKNKMQILHFWLLLVITLPLTLRKTYRYSEFFWFVFFRIRTEYREIWSISLYSVQMRENTDQKNSENGHFSSSVNYESLHWFLLLIYWHNS